MSITYKFYKNDNIVLGQNDYQVLIVLPYPAAAGCLPI